MIILRSIGGLGNQMFEYAFARNMQLMGNDELYIDIGAYDTYKIRNYDLDKLNVKYTRYQSKGLKFKFIRLLQIAYHCIHKISKSVFGNFYLGRRVYEILCSFGLVFNFDFCFYETKNVKHKNKYVYGYFQSERYFLDNKEQICSELKVKGPIPEKHQALYEEIKNNNSVGVSIRVGEDYSKDSLIYVCTPEYFYSSMRKISERIENPVFYIFSDLPDVVKKTFEFPFPVVYVENVNAIESLRLLYTCKHFVISNSSFSWWGSYLSDNKDKLVYAPAHFSTNRKLKDDDIFFDGVIKNEGGVL